MMKRIGSIAADALDLTRHLLLGWLALDLVLFILFAGATGIAAIFLR